MFYYTKFGEAPTPRAATWATPRCYHIMIWLIRKNVVVIEAKYRVLCVKTNCHSRQKKKKKNRELYIYMSNIYGCAKKKEAKSKKIRENGWHIYLFSCVRNWRYLAPKTMFLLIIVWNRNNPFAKKVGRIDSWAGVWMSMRCVLFALYTSPPIFRRRELIDLKKKKDETPIVKMTKQQLL